MKNLLFFICVLITTIVHAQTIGTTTYDLQTNASARNRIRVYDDGRISAAWTGSTAMDNAWADRGSFYNHFNGATWGAAPTARIESTRTGWPELLTVGSREVVLSHEGVAAIQVFQNTAIGSTTWTELSGSDDVTGFWPSAVCPDGTNDIYVITSNANPPTAINFSRSDNGGNTWTVLNSALPFLSAADGITALSAYAYQIAVNGNDVYILYGTSWTDLKLLHSPTKGTPGSWTETILIDFPIDNYTGELGEFSDVDADGIGDTIETTDAFHKMLITNDGTVHVWSGYYLLIDLDPDVEGWGYIPSIPGQWYWNSTMAAPMYLDLLIDWNNVDGLNDPYAGIGTDLNMYDGVTFTSMAGAAYDESSGNLFLIYTMPIEYTDVFGDPTNVNAQSYRDIFGVFSDDNGTTWSEPVNLTNTAELHKENVFAFAFDKVVDGKVHVMWMQDNNPGTALDVNQTDPVAINKIRYQGFDTSAFGAVAGCDIVAGPTGLFAGPIGSTTVTLQWNAVAGAAKYQVMVYPVADPADKTKKKPVSNAANIIGLIPETYYAWKVKTICPDGSMSPYSATSIFTTGPMRLGDAAAGVFIYPNPSDGNFTLGIEGYQNKVVQIEIFNSVGEIIFSQERNISIDQYIEQIDLNIIPSGIYHMKLRCETEVNVNSLIIK